jgi:hypothetical protein
MALTHSRVVETARQASVLATAVAALQADLIAFLAFNTTQNITYTPATKVFTYANAADVCTSNAHGLLNGQKGRLTNSGGALPTGLATGTDYFLVNVAANTFQLSLTLGGAVVNATGDGTGTHTFNPVPEYIAEESGNGNLSGLPYDRIQVSNAIGALNNISAAITANSNLSNCNLIAQATG